MGFPRQKSSSSFSSSVCDSSSTESEDDAYFIWNSKVQNQDLGYFPRSMDDHERIALLHRRRYESARSKHGRSVEGKMENHESIRGKKRKLGHNKKKQIFQISDDNDDDDDLEDLNVPATYVADRRVLSRSRPRAIWFQLVASNIKNYYHDNLPSLPPYYIQIKDVYMTVSIIKKYLVAKLGLKSADELEINMQGEPVHPDTELWRLMEIWVNTAKRWDAKPEDLVIIFTYTLSRSG